MGAAYKGADQGKLGCPDPGTYLVCGGPVSHAVRVRNMVHDPPYWEGLGILHHRVTHRLTWRQPWIGRDGVWVYPCWRTQWWRPELRRWRPTFPVARTRSHSLLRPGQLWTCVWQWSGGRGQGWPISGGSRMDWMWMKCGWWIGKRNGCKGRSRETGWG